MYSGGYSMVKSIMIRTFFMSLALFGCSERRTEGLLVMDNKELKEDLKVLGEERVFF